jgi:hypothetical protein
MLRKQLLAPESPTDDVKCGGIFYFKLRRTATFDTSSVIRGSTVFLRELRTFCLTACALVLS